MYGNTCIGISLFSCRLSAARGQPHASIRRKTEYLDILPGLKAEEDVKTG